MTAADENTAIALRVVVPRLSWALRGAGVAEAFSDRCDSLGIDDVDADGVDALLIRTRQATAVLLALETTDGRRLQTLGPFETKGPEGRWSFPLNRFLDTARTSPHSHLQLRVEVAEGESCRVATLHARHEVADLQVESLIDRQSGLTLLAVSWTENRPFSGRRLRLWSVASPWTRPASFDVPDEVRGRHEVVSDSAILPPGPYLAELTVVDDWALELRPRPQRRDVARIEIGTSTDHREHLSTLDPTNPYDFLELMLLGRAPVRDFAGELPLDALDDIAVVAADLLVSDPVSTVTSDQLAAIRAVLFSDPDRLPDVITELDDDGRVDGLDLLRLSVVTLTDALDCPLSTTDARGRERLMSVAPVLGAALDGWPETEQARGRWSEQLGWAPPVEGQSLPALGGPIQDFMLDLSVARLTRLRDVLNLADAGLLSPDGFIDAMLSAAAAHAGPASREALAHCSPSPQRRPGATYRHSCGVPRRDHAGP